MANSLLDLAAELLREDRSLARRPEEGLELAREVSDTWSISVGTATLGRCSRSRRPTARRRARRSAARSSSWRRGDNRNVSECLRPGRRRRNGDPRVARASGAPRSALRAAIGASRVTDRAALEERYLGALRPALGEL